MRVIEVNESAFALNDRAAEALRNGLKEEGIFLLNVMSAPGSGKTVLLSSLINELKERLNIAVMDVDIESTADADRLFGNTGVPCVQIHNGGLCHIDAEMVAEAIRQADFGKVDLIVLENIGNLVCPAEFDTGAHMNIMLSSVPEGDDKPLKCPLMFKVCDAVIVTKTDTLPIFDFDAEKFRGYVKSLNPEADIFEVSAKTGSGVNALAEYIYRKIKYKGD